jgi:hypothetical protein
MPPIKMTRLRIRCSFRFLHHVILFLLDPVEEAIFFLYGVIRGYIRHHAPENNCRFSRDRGILREGDRLSEIARIKRLRAEVA